MTADDWDAAFLLAGCLLGGTLAIAAMWAYDRWRR